MQPEGNTSSSPALKGRSYVCAISLCSPLQMKKKSQIYRVLITLCVSYLHITRPCRVLRVVRHEEDDEDDGGGVESICLAVVVVDVVSWELVIPDEKLARASVTSLAAFI